MATREERITCGDMRIGFVTLDNLWCLGYDPTIPDVRHAPSVFGLRYHHDYDAHTYTRREAVVAFADYVANNP